MGVKAVANDLKVQLSRAPRDDSDIARAIAHILEWNVQIPEGKVHARVENGWVTLDGEVDYDYQKREVERMVNHVRGVAGVRNFITVRPPASPEAVEAAIEQAFRREAEVDARHVKVEVKFMLLTVAPIIFIVMSIYKPFAILNNIQNFYPTTEK